MTKQDAEKIVSLFKSLENVNSRLAEIEAARTRGTQFIVQFKLKNKDGSAWGDVEGLKASFGFRDAGNLNDFAAIFLGRLSDQEAS